MSPDVRNEVVSVLPEERTQRSGSEDDRSAAGTGPCVITGLAQMITQKLVLLFGLKKEPTTARSEGTLRQTTEELRFDPVSAALERKGIHSCPGG